MQAIDGHIDVWNIIYSDCWKIFKSLRRVFQNFTVKYNFINLDSGVNNIQMIEHL